MWAVLRDRHLLLNSWANGLRPPYRDLRLKTRLRKGSATWLLRGSVFSPLFARRNGGSAFPLGSAVVTVAVAVRFVVGSALVIAATAILEWVVRDGRMAESGYLVP